MSGEKVKLFEDAILRKLNVCTQKKDIDIRANAIWVWKVLGSCIPDYVNPQVVKNIIAAARTTTGADGRLVFLRKLALETLVTFFMKCEAAKAYTRMLGRYGLLDTVLEALSDPHPLIRSTALSLLNSLREREPQLA
jgi:HEAT repeat protein